MQARNLIKASAALVAGLVLAGNVFGYEDIWHGGGGDGDWANALNWESPSYPGAHFAPDPGSSVVLTDQYVTANVTLYSGWGSTIGDFTALANAGSGGDTSFTMKSGTSLHSTNNFDLGYNAGSETVTFTMEQNTTLTVDGYFGGGHAGPHQSLIAGTINTNKLSIGGADLIHLSPTAIITAKGNQYAMGDISDDLNTWINAGLFTTDSGYQVVHSYDSGTQLTTISVQAVPEPTMGGLLLLGAAGLLGRRRRRA